MTAGVSSNPMGYTGPIRSATDRCILSLTFSVCYTPHMNRTDDFPNTWEDGRRKRALELQRYGWQPCESAAAFGVSAAAVSPWVAEARVRGREAWRAEPRPIGPGKRTSDQVHRI
jgi:hypothetical protein